MSAPSSAEPSRQQARKKIFLRLVAGGVSMSVISGLAKGVLGHWDVPFWARVLIALAPLLPLLALACTPSPLAKADELEMRINQESTAFAFYGLFAVVVVVDLLGRGGVLSGFVWKTEFLFIAMFLLLVLGYGWAACRYR